MVDKTMEIRIHPARFREFNRGIGRELNSYLHGFVDHHPLLLIVCGAAVKMSGQFMATIDLKSLLGTPSRRNEPRLYLARRTRPPRRLHRTYVSDLERGARNPSVDSIEKLAGHCSFRFQVFSKKRVTPMG